MNTFTACEINAKAKSGNAPTIREDGCAGYVPSAYNLDLKVT